jgi:hypothetical protein
MKTRMKRRAIIMGASQLILLAFVIPLTGCTSAQLAAHPNITEPEIRKVVVHLNQLKPGMTKVRVWNILGKLPLERNVVWVSAGSDWGEGCDGYLLTHGYGLRLLWDQTDYDHWKYRRAWFEHNATNRIEFPAHRTHSPW